MSSIDHLRVLVRGEKSQDPMAWGQLALNLQAADVRFHADSSKMQPEAVRNALFCHNSWHF